MTQVQANQQSRRDESSPRALHRNTFDVGAERAPSQRDLFAEKRRIQHIRLALMVQTTTTSVILLRSKIFQVLTLRVSHSADYKNTATSANLQSTNLTASSAGPFPLGKGDNVDPPGLPASPTSEPV